ncbi:uncharacterized protein LOC129618842 [Condylostylus longicornis]|uniref:uncharacterized protein LOC129618842 n=1 Tax=Condylostylus longicornis TaxID=2530218 RepID=UPI00244DEC2E|nr:uncharacterized protein LOC129618842 [Condylostylus longicornis]
MMVYAQILSFNNLQYDDVDHNIAGVMMMPDVDSDDIDNIMSFSTQETLCPDHPECATCWEECGKPPPSKLAKTIQETWSLRTVSMLQQDSLVLVDVAWDPQLNTPNQCLVTWEVSGGGLMGNLLTETYSVQLSLWPDTKYRVQVTCKNKNTGSMSRSLPLNIDTSEAITTHLPIRTTRKPIIQSTSKQQSQTSNILITTTQSSLMANLPFATSSSSASAPISAPIPTFMDHPLSSFEDNDEDNIENIDDQHLNEISSNKNRQQQQQHQQIQDEQHEQKQQPIQYINHKHTNYIFDWHHGKAIDITDDNTQSDVQIDKLIPLNQSDLNIITIATLSDIQKPLLFGVVAGILLLTFVLAMYICALRSQRVPSDKTALIEDDGCNSSLDNHNTNICNSSCIENGFSGCNGNGICNGDSVIGGGIGGGGVGGVGGGIINPTATSNINIPPYNAATNHFGSGPSNILNPNFYSRNVHVLTV